MSKLVGTWVRRQRPDEKAMAGEIVEVFHNGSTPYFLVLVGDRFHAWQANGEYLTIYPNPAGLKGYRE